MWIKRLLGLILFCLLAVLIGHQLGYSTLPLVDTQTAMILSVALVIVFTIVLRLLVLAAAASFLMGLFLLAAIIVASQFFFLEREQARFYATQLDAPLTSDSETIRHKFLATLGIDVGRNIIEDSLMHGYTQAETALQSQQLGAAEVGLPQPELSPRDVWQAWLYQLIMLCSGVVISVLFGRKKLGTHK